ncbi:MAG: small ribosomal subunit biogenesis GTPase RsgA [Leptolyngbya sp. SIO4C5]|nr:small ribosomal subunit biogenesis GTPase RsgA [Leptolyngbya sp. SIO4C5]
MTILSSRFASLSSVEPLKQPPPAELAANGPESTLWGTVLAVQANFYFIKLDRAASDVAAQPASPAVTQLLCTRRSRLKKMGQRVIVGDRVRIEEPDWEGERGAIAEVQPRQTFLDRPPVANANQILLVFALAEPEPDPYQLSRFLVKAESTDMAVSVCLNKRDLVSASVQQAWCDRLQGWGYQSISLSVQQGAALPALQMRLRNKITIVSGPSGVGKSSLINQLVPQLDLRTSQVSGKLGRGRHTTRHVELFELPTGGFIADTPGFNQPDVICQPQQLSWLFPEIRQRLQQSDCQFNNCLHRDEPGCAVRGDWERYDYYLTMLEEAIAQQVLLEQQSDRESTVKFKTTESGLQAEPKLQAKKYRRRSRRSQNQALQDLYLDLTETTGSVEDWEERSLDD